MRAYALSLAAGLAVGVAYGLLGVRSPAPPIIALLGLLGMLAGEAAAQYLRGHPDVLAQLLHTKSFAASRVAPPVMPQAANDLTHASDAPGRTGEDSST